MRRRLRRAYTWVADRFPLTPRGTLVLALSLLSLWLLGIGSLDLVVFVAALAGLTLVTLGVLAVTITSLVLWRRFRPDSTRSLTLEADSPIRTSFSAPALSFLPIIRLSWDWIDPAGVEVRQRIVGARLLEEVVARRRGVAGDITRRVIIGDVFGLACIRWKIKTPTGVTIFPNVGRLKNTPVVRSLSGGEGIPHPMGAPEGDRMDIRRYAPRDPVRNIVWKMYARTRQLNVRTPERAIAPARRTVAYLVTGEGDEPAAAAARVAVESGALGSHWQFSADGTAESISEVGEARIAIARSGSLGRSNGFIPGSGLLPFLARVNAASAAHCIVFAPALDGPWLKHVLGAARKYPGALSVVVGTDGVDRRQTTPVWKRMLLSPLSSSAVPVEELSRVLRALASSGVSTVVIDRGSGRAYSELVRA